MKLPILASLLIAVILAAAFSASAAGIVPSPFPFPAPSPSPSPPSFDPSVNLDTGLTVASRLSFDPSSSVSIIGAGDPRSQVSSDNAEVSFTALDYKRVRIDGVRILNHGSTSTIAQLEVNVPPGFLVDVRNTNFLTDTIRNMSPTTFAVPIDGANGNSPGVAQVAIDVMYWNESAIISPVNFDQGTSPAQYWSSVLSGISESFDQRLVQRAWAASSLNVVAFKDVNRNGVEDPGETRLSGWNVKIYERKSDGSLFLTRTGTTDSNGLYITTSLSGDRTWVVKLESPAAPLNCTWTQILPGAPTYQHEFFLADKMGKTVYFANALDCNAPLTVTKFFDKNRNGLQDVGEGAIANSVIQVYDSTGATIVGQETTDSQGVAVLTLPVDKTYVVRSQPAPVPDNCPQGSWVSIVPSAPTYSSTLNLSISGATLKFADALSCLATVFNYYDQNGNGVRDLGESGLQGWNIEILDQNMGAKLQEEITDSSGNAMFSLPMNQTYVAREVLPQETSCSGGLWKQTQPGAPGKEIQFYLPSDGGVDIQFGNTQICPTERYVITLKLHALD